MDEKGIQRINELAHKAKAEGLTPAEKAEQKKLRQKFLADIRANVRSQLNNISVIEKDLILLDNGERIPLSRNRVTEIKRQFMQYINGGSHAV